MTAAAQRTVDSRQHSSLYKQDTTDGQRRGNEQTTTTPLPAAADEVQG